MKCKRCEKRDAISKGFCSSCYSWYHYNQHKHDEKFMSKRRSKRREYINERYRNDYEFREKVLKNRRQYARKKYIDDPDWNAKRQREYRKKHPDVFNYLMARYYFKKLTAEKRKRLIWEVAK